MNNTSHNNRSVFFDQLKGILIVFVILGHVMAICPKDGGINSSILYLIIYSFHMPLFVGISGYFSVNSYKKSFNQMIASRVKRLMVPLFLYSTILFLLYYISGTYNNDLLSPLHKLYNCYVSYWYLINIVVLTTLFWLVKKIRYVGVVLLLIYLYFIAVFDSLPSYILKDCQVIRLALVFGIGLFCRKVDMRSIPSVWIWLLSILALLVILFDRVQYGANVFSYSILIRIVDGVVCSILFFLLFFAISRRLENNLLGKWLSFVGRYSLSFYLVHLVYIRLIVYFNQSPSFSFVNVTILSLTIYLFTHVTIVLFEKIVPEKYHYLVGI